MSHGCAGDVHASRWVALRVRVRLAGPRRASGSAWDRFSESFSVWSDDAKRKVGETARGAADEFNRAAWGVSDRARRAAGEAARRVDWERRNQTVQARVVEWARDVDQRWQLSLRFRELREDAARKWPRWVQQAKEFYATPLGKVAAVVLLAALLATGVLSRLLYVAYLAFLFGPLLMPPLLSYLAKRDLEAQLREEELRKARRNPFDPAFWSNGGARAGGPNRGQTKRGPYDDGPVIDVSAERID